MDLVFDLAPLALLLIFAVWAVARGMRNDTHNRDTGGGYDGPTDGD